MSRITLAVQAKAIELGKLAVRATTAADSGHPTTALSLAHLVTVLMYRVMRWDPKQPAAPGSDRLVLSEGHAVPIVYAACADLGVTITPGGQPRPMTMEDLMCLRTIDSPIDGHPNPVLGFPFFDAATGSLGQGLSVSGGLAGAARIDRVDKTIYCIMGDGESREGQIWEAMDFIADHALTNVVAIFNCNTLGQSDFVSSAEDWQQLKHKAEAFRWTAVAIDGHDPDAIEDTLRRRKELGAGKPICVVARTLKGWGVPSLSGMGHHGQPVPKSELEAVLSQLDQRAEELGVAHLDPAAMKGVFQIPPPLPAPEAPRARELIGFWEAVRNEPKIAEALAKKKVLSPRRAYGLALKALGAANPAVVALDADVKNSTYALDFAKAFPDRYFEARIAEQNMVSVAAGLSSGRKLPFVSTFGRFLERACDQIEMALIGGANLKLDGSHVGVTLAADGPSQMALADVAFMRAFTHVRDHRGNPALTVLTPSDARSTYALVLAMAAFPSACYVRTVRGDLPLLYEGEEQFPLVGHKVLRRAAAGTKRIVLAACGYMVHSCLKAADILSKQHGVEATVVDAYSLPLDSAQILALAGPDASIITVEDNYVGGLGSELAEAAASARDHAPQVKSLCVHNIPKSGLTPEDVLAYVHLSVEEIVAAAVKAAR
jgi:transketolase